MSNQFKISKDKSKEVGALPKKLLAEITAIYTFLIMVVYPLYYQNKYYNMGEAKWMFFRNVSLICMGLLCVAFLWYIGVVIYKQGTDRLIGDVSMSKVDWFVLAYFIMVLLSFILSPYKDSAIWGYDGWYMGLLSQICFVLIYFFVSRFWYWDRPVALLYLGTSAVVFLLAVLMRFMIDPLEMYKDLGEQYIILFLTTIGQATWYSSYMCILFPIGMFVFWYYDNKVVRILSGLYTALGFMTMVTQNSDSAFVSFFFIFLTLFCFSFRSNKEMKRFLEVALVALVSFRFMGICQILFPDQAVDLDRIPTFTSQSPFLWLVLAFVLICYLVLYLLDKKEGEKKFDIAKYKVVPKILVVLTMVGILAVVIYIYLNTTGKLPQNLQSTNNYLLFDEFWGNNRGSSWQIAAMTFTHSNPLRIIFGCGPDCFSSFVYESFGAQLNEKWGANTILTNAHNEWFTSIINFGVLGGLCYLGIFVSAASEFFKKMKTQPILLGIGISIVAYMSHNFFCYQQAICTPVIFILIGIGEALIRRGMQRE